MICPTCNTYLHETSFNKVAVDVCYTCEGSYLDGGELATLMDTQKDITGAEGKGPTEFKCPRCHGAMEEVKYSPDLDVLLNRCQKCGGLWTEKGELGEIGRFLNKFFLRTSPGIPEMIRIRNSLYNGFTAVSRVKQPVSREASSVQTRFLRTTYRWYGLSLLLLAAGSLFMSSLEINVCLIGAASLIMLVANVLASSMRSPVPIQGILLIVLAFLAGILAGHSGIVEPWLLTIAFAGAGVLYMLLSFYAYRGEMPDDPACLVFQVSFWTLLCLLAMYLILPGLRDIFHEVLRFFGLLTYLTLGSLTIRYKFEKGKELQAALFSYFEPFLLIYQLGAIWIRHRKSGTLSENHTV